MAKRKNSNVEAVEAKREIETTRAIREANVRLKQALLDKRCRYCGQQVWSVYKTDGKVRYIKCHGCGRTDKIVVPLPDVPTTRITGQ